MARKSHRRNSPLRAIATRWRSRAVELLVAAHRLERLSPEDLTLRAEAQALVGCAATVEDLADQIDAGEA